MNFVRRTALSSAALTLILASTVQAAEEKVLAVVGGTAITESALVAYGQMRMGGNAQPAAIEEKRRDLLEDLINRELVYQDALGKGFDKAPEVVLQFNEQKRTIVANYGVAKIIESTPLNNDVMRKAYQTHVVELASVEYKARHILNETEEQAKAIIVRLNKGENFVDVAKAQSDGSSAEDGGDLGWFAPNQMVKPFADAVATLKPGAFTNRPVRSQFGWHVILLEETRKVDPPAFDLVEKHLRSVVQSEAVKTHIDGLRQKAKIEMK